MAEFTTFRPCSGKIRFSDYKYHVFLSFRGPDVRKSLVDHLFQSLTAAGIHAFLDNERLEKGENIGSSLVKAIENSAILIPIFSNGYADSSWCLEEVRQIWKYRSTKIIIPLFYGVDPSDVRYPLKDKGAYAKAFKKHDRKGRFGSDIIDEWKGALHYVSSLSGWSLHMVAGYEARLVKQVVSDITALNYLPRPVPQKAVGLEHHVLKIKESLALHLIDRTILVGIWGIGGIGKTTLADAIFNEIACTFEASCFLSDIRGAQERGGMIRLQTQMLKDLSKVDIKVNDINHGESLLQFHLGSIRSLVILDNVDHWSQLESFMLDCCGAGSRVIITTRDRHILNLLSMPSENIYELQCLREDEALELFSWHVFQKAHPDDSYKDLSTKMTKASGGVPLTLEVLGACLFDKKTSDKCWIEALKMLENLTYPEIFQPLKISYDSLLLSEKEIFLDIACFFIGQDTEEPAIFWEELGLNVNTALQNLQLKLLIKIGNDNKFTMHDLLRDFARAIVADEGNPCKRSRLWKQEDVHKVINEKLGTENVKYLLYAQEREGTRLKEKCLASMNGLRYLCLNDNIIIEGETNELSPDLKWLKWNGCSLDVLPPQWNLEHLAILDLSSRSISHVSDLQFSLKHLWNEQSRRKVPKNLRVLRVNWCPNLQRLPAFSFQKSLVKLDLTGCSLITELPDSLGFQEQLYYLELSCCSRLEKLPDCIGNLLELKHLGLAECSSLKALPYSIGCLQKLQYLNLFQCEKLEQLPSSIMKLSCLQKIILSYCSNLNNLPDILAGLKSLKIFELHLESCPIVTLPASVGHLKQLRCLNMNHCASLCVLPNEIGGLESLEELLLNKCENLTKIPSIFSKLQYLVRFEAGNCDLKSIPESFGELSSLKILHLEHNKFSTLPLNCTVLSQLTELVLRGCTELIELPFLPEGLVTLDIEGCIKLKMLPKMAHLKRMQMLTIASCSEIVQSNILWEVRALTTLQIIHGSAETLQLTRVGSRNDLNDTTLQTIHGSGEIARELTGVGSRNDLNQTSQIIHGSGVTVQELSRVGSKNYRGKKMVFKMSIEDEISKRRVFKLFAKIEGVDSITIDMEEKKITVFGETDPVYLTLKLRKFGYSDLLRVGPATEGDVYPVSFMNRAEKMVFKVSINDELSKRKALKLIAAVEGVISIKVDMSEKKFTVIGEADPVYLTSKLRKFAYTELLSVRPVIEHLQIKTVLKMIFKLSIAVAEGENFSIHEEQCRLKALNVLGSVEGVDSVMADMDENRITVIGELDPAYLTSKMRKFGYTLLSAGPTTEGNVQPAI